MEETKMRLYEQHLEEIEKYEQELIDEMEATPSSGRCTFEEWAKAVPLME